MPAEENKAIARRNFERLDQRDVDGVLEDFAPGIRIHGFAPQALGPEEYRHGIGAFLDAFPDSRFTVEDVVAEGEHVAVRHTFRGTHRGEFEGVPATGRRVAVSGIELLRFEGGKIAEAWLNADFLGLMQQLGAIPEPAQA